MKFQKIKMRLGYIKIGNYESRCDALGRKLCLNCQSPIYERGRHRYCSKKCCNDFLVKNNHRLLRKQLIRESLNRCWKCNEKFHSRQLILDHITPIAAGGEEFAKWNLQILCRKCNTSKTKIDMKVILEIRQKISGRFKEN